MTWSKLIKIGIEWYLQNIMIFDKYSTSYVSKLNYRVTYLSDLENTVCYCTAKMQTQHCVTSIENKDKFGPFIHFGAYSKKGITFK